MKFDVSLKKIEDENSKLKAVATVNFGDAFTVKNIRVYEGDNGLFVAMPNYKRNEPDSHGNEYKDICYPITADNRLSRTKSRIKTRISRRMIDQSIKVDNVLLQVSKNLMSNWRKVLFLVQKSNKIVYKMTKMITNLSTFLP